MATCKVCGERTPFFSDCHPECAQQAARAEGEQLWAQRAADWETGTRQVIGAAMFLGDAMAASRGHSGAVVPLVDVVWVYHRRVRHWAWLIPLWWTHELIIRGRDGVELTCCGSKDEVLQSIAELTRRVPWAMFGYTPLVRAAMAPAELPRTLEWIDATRRRIYERRME